MDDDSGKNAERVLSEEERVLSEGERVLSEEDCVLSEGEEWAPSEEEWIMSEEDEETLDSSFDERKLSHSMKKYKAMKAQQYRKNMTKLTKQKVREQSRERQRRYREKIKLKQNVDPVKIEKQRRYWRDRKKIQRAKLTPKKKAELMRRELQRKINKMTPDELVNAIENTTPRKKKHLRNLGMLPSRCEKKGCVKKVKAQ